MWSRPFDHDTVRRGLFVNVPDKSGGTVDNGGNGRRMGHDKRVLVPTHNGRGRQSTSGGSLFLTAPQMTALLMHHSVAARENKSFSMHSFRLGGAVSRACAVGTCINHHAESVLEEPTHGMEVHEARLAEVLSQGTTGHTKAPGITDEQYRQINEFPLMKQSTSWAAFAHVPMGKYNDNR